MLLRRLCLLVGLSLLLAACSPEREGKIGIGRGADGVLTIWVNSCGSDAVDLVWINQRRGSTLSERMRATPKVRETSVELILADPGDGWDVSGDPISFSDRGDFSAIAKLGSKTSPGLDFTLDDLRNLQKGEVLTPPKVGETTSQRSSIDEFRTQPCT